MKQLTKDTVLKQGDKTYHAIEVEQGIVWVDKDAIKGYKGDWIIETHNSVVKNTLCQLSSEWDLNRSGYKDKLIVASTFDLEGVPKIELEDEVDKLAKLEFPLSNPNNNWLSNEIELRRRLFIKGYKANPAKYTEEQMKTALIMAKETVEEGGKLMAEYSILDILQFLNSIKEITVDGNFKILESI